MQLGSWIDLITTSMSASAICHQCFTISFFKDVMVDLRVPLQSSAKRLPKVSIMSTILSLYDRASAGFCGPESGKSSGLSSGTLMISTGALFEDILMFRNLPKEGATLGLLLPKQGKLWCFGMKQLIKCSWLWSDCWPLVSFLHQPITIQYSLSLIDFWVWWVEPTSAIKGNPLVIPTISTLHMQSMGET